MSSSPSPAQSNMNDVLKSPAAGSKLWAYKPVVADGGGAWNQTGGGAAVLDVYLPGPPATANSSSYLPGGSGAGNSSADDGGRGVAEMLALGGVLGLLDLVTILGNLLVCVTILSTRRLQSCTHLLIFSLSLSDLLLGLAVLPFSTLTTLTGGWPLGAVSCNLWISADVMLCTVSILTLFTISLDRYLAVTMPFRYLCMVTHRRIYLVCGAIWASSFLIGFLPIHLGWNTETGEVQNLSRPGVCVFETNRLFALLVAVTTYFCPLVVMCAVYCRVFKIARQQVKRINELTKYGSTAVSNGHSGAGASPDHHQAAAASDSKATFTLASVVLAFTVCWLPYFVLFTAKPFLDTPVDPHVDLFFLWLGYVNSLLNPFLYAFHNTEFRYGFLSVLCRGHRYRGDRFHGNDLHSEAVQL